MPSYLLLLHEAPSVSGALSSAEIHDIIAAHQAWVESLIAAGAYVSSNKLTDDGGRHLRGAVASDGPYAEAHDVIGGYYVISVPDMAAAERLAVQCPHQGPSQWIEIREIEVLG